MPNIFKENYISFEMEDIDSQKIHDNIFKIDNVHFKTHQINYKQVMQNYGLKNLDPEYQYLYTEVKYSGLKKNIYFYSPLLFKNRTLKTFIIKVKRPKLKHLAFDLKPGRVIGIPYEYLDGEIQFFNTDGNFANYQLILFLNYPTVKQMVFQEKIFNFLIQVKVYIFSIIRKNRNPVYALLILLPILLYEIVCHLILIYISLTHTTTIK